MEFTNTAWFHTVVIGLMALGNVFIANAITEVFGINNKFIENIILFGLYMPMFFYYLSTRTNLFKK